MPPKPDDRGSVPTTASLTPERFAQVRAIFEAALEFPPAQRRAYAVGACGNDAELLREVEQMLAAEDATNTLLPREPSQSSSSTPEEGRFPAGTVLAGRYRILGLLGRGGMGEVYKAFDLILNQTVALKFLLPTHLSEAALVRFRNEVRIARQVSHPNVARVYDLGMVEGLHFLSMEFIDGENLSSLLRRIGRLPQDKAMEFTRRICAGLAAAHERGVLHRDLKPANIMIDGRGQPRITDFGLAGLAAEIPLSDLRSGTPAYMSPEQKAGKEVTTRSDLYSLGMVLHEMFTGKARVNDSSAAQATPSEIVKDLDPAIERLILRCLEEEPKRRPSTALAVMMGLPGADPIAAALAAGETPSPEMVAASQEKEGFSSRTAVLCFAAIVLALAAGVWLARSIDFTARAPLPRSEERLAADAERLLRSMGYTDEPEATAYGFACCDSRVNEHLAGYDRAQRNAILASHQPPVIAFWYREHRRPFGSGNGPYGRVTADSPPTHEPGMRLVRLDATGRLLHLHVEPWTEEPGDESGKPVDWPALFAAAGLDLTRFSEEASPRGIPPMMAEYRLSWTGSYADDRREEVRVEAASWQGRAVWFNVRAGPPFEAASEAHESRGVRFARVVNQGLSLLVIPGVLFMAWRNWRLHRVDTRGAAQLAGVTLLGVGAFSISLLIVGMVWLYYIAIEPHARRYWPDALISWSRLSRGQLRNPLVASHVLAGLTVATIFSLVLFPLMEALALADASMPSTKAIFLSGSPVVWGMPMATLALGPFQAVSYLYLIVLIRLTIRKIWPADLLAVAIAHFVGVPDSFGGSTLLGALMMGPGLVWIWLIRRFGFLAFVSLWTFALPLMFVPHHLSGWLRDRLLFWHLIPVVVAAWAVWVILSAAQRTDATDAAG